PPHSAGCFVDSNLAAAHPLLLEKIVSYFAARPYRIALVKPPVILTGGETAKNDLGLVEAMMATMLETRLDRHSFVIAIGGGAVLDAVGLAAALVHRGLRLIRVPTTVLSQNDGGVGVKNGVNFRGGKNGIG